MSTNRAISLNPLRLNRLIYIILLLFISCGTSSAQVIVGAERTDVYLPLLAGKKVGILTNHTGRVGDRHLVDTLLALGIDVRTVFAPEHGFRGNVEAGAKVGSYRDPETGINVVSVYGSNRKPKKEDVCKLDVVLFDIQDVGLRYYTYLSSMHLMMETCAETGVPMIVLDRPNPNGMYADGPVIEEKYRSFVGMHPIPVVHGMTLGELARMINGEGWLGDDKQCLLTVIECVNYYRSMQYVLPIAPSPNLPDMRSVYLYPSLCCFEGTAASMGRGTAFPFQVYGHPGLKGVPGHDFTFVPRPNAGSKTPPLEGQMCYGRDLRNLPGNETVIANGIDLTYVIDCYRVLRGKLGDQPFFTPMFEKLLGAGYIRRMIVEGRSNDEIRTMWKGDVERFMVQRKPYLLYE